MKIAIPTQNDEVFQHFGQSKEFTIFEVENHIVKGSSKIDTSDSGHSALVEKLKNQNVNMLICGGLGQGAMDKLEENNIEVLPGVTGNAKDALIKYLSGEKIGNADYRCNHHGDDHVCSH